MNDKILINPKNQSELPMNYFLMENRKIVRYCSWWKTAGLPKISEEYEDVLKEVGAEYSKTDDGNLEYWDPEFIEVENASLPLYVKMGEGYRYVRNHTEKEYSIITIEKAHKLTDIIEKEIEKRKKTQEYKEILGDKKAAVYTSDSFYYIDEDESDIYIDGEKIKVLDVIRMKTFRPVTWYDDFETDIMPLLTQYKLIVNVSKINYNEDLTIEVPKGKEGLFIGKDGWQIKKWKRIFGLRRISIIGV